MTLQLFSQLGRYTVCRIISSQKVFLFVNVIVVVINSCIYCRLAINDDDYNTFDSCKDVTIIASAFKLFLREMVEPLITKEMRNFLYSSDFSFEKSGEIKQLLGPIRKSLDLLEPLICRTLRYVLLHLKRMSDVKGS